MRAQQALLAFDADLVKHLGNEADKADKPVTMGALQASAKRDELEEERRVAASLKNRKPVEYGGSDDFQLAQAINHFKGLPVKLSKADVALEAPEAQDGRKRAAPQAPPELKAKAPTK